MLLTFGVMFGMMYFRTSTLRRGETRLADISLREPNWPPRATQFGYAFANQFELPVLFYVLTILVIITHHADLLFVLLAWIFVVMRVLQAVVHVTNNNVRIRGAYLRCRRARIVHHVGDLHRPYLARTAMTPAARLAAAIEVFAAIEKERRPAADALKAWGLTHRYAGSGDRAAIASLVYDALRRRASSAFVMGADTPRAIVQACSGASGSSIPKPSRGSLTDRNMRRRC